MNGGAILITKSAKFDNFYPIFFQFLPLNMQIFAIFPQKNANLDNFFQKKCKFEKFSTSESEKYGETFSQFFLLTREEIKFFGRQFTYGGLWSQQKFDFFSYDIMPKESHQKRQKISQQLWTLSKNGDPYLDVGSPIYGLVNRPCPNDSETCDNHRQSL